MPNENYVLKKDIRSFVEYLVSNLVDDPEQVNVREIESDVTKIIEVSVAKEDMGKIIGKHGRIARALRIITKTMASRDGSRVMIEIID